MGISEQKIILIRNLAAFWIFGLCNNYAYTIMLSAAEDILDKQQHKEKNDTENHCLNDITESHCSSVSTGAVLLADILPSLFVKITFPFFMQKIPSGMRHGIVCALQVTCYLIVAFSTSVTMSLMGVTFAAAGMGLGEITYLGLSSYFPRSVVAAWSSGTGGAGIIGSLAYAGLTEPHLANLSPKNACLAMLIVPILFAVAYWFLMVVPDTVHQVQILKPGTWIVNGQNLVVCSTRSVHSRTASEVDWSSNDTKLEKSGSVNPIGNEFINQRHIPFKEKLLLIVPMLKYMIPLVVVYIAEYAINQGLTTFLGFADSPNITVLYEGVLGGSAYSNTFYRIHQEVAPDIKEYSLSVATMADAVGIATAAFIAIPLHNFVCNQQKYHIH
ncbi:hypothetical protein FO519_007938 [Halicephalobus sp. NKZ332]|nr:hypothetical protein FO519_007938 [Halicephalobus sp. NKZ332]